MRKLRISVPFRIGLLLFIGLSVIYAGGFFTYKRLTEVVNSIHREKITQTGLPAIRYLTTSIEQAENYMRLYGITRSRKYLGDYNELTSSIDSSIQILYNHYPDDEWFTMKIDTINTLFEHKKVLWKEMSRIWQNSASSHEISSLTDEIKMDDQASRDSTRRFLARLFSSKDDGQSNDNEKLLEKLNELERDEKQFENNLSQQEIELALTSNMLSEAFISLMAQLEEYEMRIEQENMDQADELVDEAYNLMAILSVFGVVLGLFGVIILVGYIRKNQAYNKILVRSRMDAEDLAKSKENFIANVSHEIRTPLNAINGFIKHLLSSDIDHTVKEKLKIVDSAGDQLIRLINDVLDFSKLQSEKLVLQPAHFKPDEVISNACLFFSEMAAKNGSVIDTQVEDVKGLVFYGDTQRFQQILYNLLSNAVKFTEKGTIRVLATTKQDRKDHVNMEIVISDTGLGIEASKLDRIFEEYAQADHEITVRYGGTGLGLSIVKKLVSLFDGDIRIESKKGVGTTVTCSLIFAKGKADEVIVAEDRATIKYNLPEGLKILVADDEPYNQELISMILDKWNITYDMAKNGLEAIEFLKKKKYDLVLMDVRMPVINGVMATKFIRETLKLSREKLPVIGITADITRQQTSEVSELFNTLLVKPFSEEELYRAVTLNNSESAGNRDKNEQPKKVKGARADISGLVRVSGNDTAFVRDMIDQFEASTMSGLEEIKTAAMEGNFALTDDLAHKLAPPARHLDAKALLEVIKKIREAADKKQEAKILELIVTARELAAGVVVSLNEQYENLND